MRSETVFLKPDQFENALRERKEFEALGLIIVKDPKVADLIIELGRPLFTYTFTFAASSSQTGVLLMSGKVTAFDGNFASPKIAKELLKRLGSARSGQRDER